MTLDGEYEPSQRDWVREQVETYERTGGAEANTLGDTGIPIVIVATRGNKSGMVRKTALMRVEHQGEYALVASMGGAPQNPVWYHNIKADPTALTIQDGPEPFDAVAREARGRRASAVVGQGRRRLPRLRGLPGTNRAAHPRLCRPSDMMAPGHQRGVSPSH